MIYNILKCIPMLLVTILILLFWIDSFIAFIATFLGALLIIPSIIAKYYSIEMLYFKINTTET